MTESPHNPAEPKKSGGAGRIIRLVVSALFALGVIAGVGTFAYNKLTEADRDKSGNVTSQGKVDVTDLAAGDCVVENLAEKEFLRVEVAPCAKAHFFETYATYELEDGDFPGEEQLDQLAGQGCYDRFADFVGVSYDDSELEMSYLMPAEETWSSDRGVACLITANGESTGSLKAAKR